MFAVCRIAHYMKSMMRDKVGSFTSVQEVERYLHNWLMQYVVDADDATQEVRATRPLRQAQVEVTEVSGKPGMYRAVAFVRPHFQLDELSVSLRLVAEIPGGKS
jgi:type VI secretion system protein ImpC